MKHKDESLKPVYVQLYESLRNDIVSGVYPLGSRFPSKRVIAERWHVSLITT